MRHFLPKKVHLEEKDGQPKWIIQTNEKIIVFLKKHKKNDFFYQMNNFNEQTILMSKRIF